MLAMLSMQETKAGRISEVQDHPWLHSELVPWSLFIGAMPVTEANILPGPHLLIP